MSYNLATVIVFISAFLFLSFGIKQCTKFDKEKLLIENGYSQSYQTNSDKIIWIKGQEK